jgi:GT2 family glycosyltransferase
VDYLTKRFASEITLIDSNHNLGFAKANNIAIRQSASEYVLLLNPDTFVGERSIAQVLEFMDAHPKAGGAGVMMHNSDGSIARESRRGLPTPYVSLLKMLGFPKRYYMSHLSWDCPGQIDVVSGAFFMLRREALDKAGLLDEDFFMYGEDIDLSYRILKAGYENWYVPGRIVHYKGESTQKSSFRYVHVFYQAMLIFFRKHYGHLSLLVTLPIKVAIYFRALIALIQMLYMRLRKSLGFFPKRRYDIVYIYKGSKRVRSRFNAIVKRKGLTTATGGNGCFVYDTSTISYEDIISDMAANPGHILGTYTKESNVIITPMEIVG